MRIANKTKWSGLVWALAYRNGSLIFNPDCYHAPQIYDSRESARAAAKEFKQHFLNVTPVRIFLNVEVFPR